ncbi:MAG TPA: glycosyl hydrolase family 28-related protein [Candidatus Hydrogenedentes bacterium]|nr:glycosyl hydrolase family 28-related protein [Candidatus Hydrogenedentota bacterium]HPG69716.1 glycosyl hydrolase family 28-related protein [Candidatus Hydrogenedentota bacterium]
MRGAIAIMGVVVLVLGVAEGESMAADATWNVADFGAVADGETDNTEAFQRALDAAAAAKGGVVIAPTGRYAFDGSLTVPKEVTLRGVYAYAPAHAGVRDRTDEMPVFGTVLMPRADAGTEDGPPFILLNTNAGLHGCCVFYPNQDPAGPVPKPYPYTVAMRGNNPSIIDCELLNPYNAIDASRNQRALIRNVHGQPLHIGVFVDQIYDIGRIENVHWNPWWSMQKELFQWQMENGVGFIFGKTDWHYVLNTFCFGYNVGYKFIHTEKGATNGNFLGIGADDCYTAVVVEDSEPYGILITNGEFVSFHGPDPTMVRVEETHRGVVRFSNCAFWGPCNRNVVADGKGIVGLSDCTFVQWGHHREGCRAVEAYGGSILVRGCTFREDRPQIYLGEGVQRAIITENLITGAERIENESEGVIVIANNAPTVKPELKETPPTAEEPAGKRAGRTGPHYERR